MITRVPTDWSKIEKDEPDQVEMLTATVACPTCGYTCTITENDTEVADRDVCRHFEYVNQAGDFAFDDPARVQPQPLRTKRGIFVPESDDLVFVLADDSGGAPDWFQSQEDAIKHITECFDTFEGFEIYKMTFADFLAWKHGTEFCEDDDLPAPVWIGT